jgi:hypothetical protein
MVVPHSTSLPYCQVGRCCVWGPGDPYANTCVREMRGSHPYSPCVWGV